MIQKETLRTKYIKNALKHYATEKLIPVSECDFEIIHTDTLVKNNQNQEFVHYQKTVLKQYLHHQKILQENIEFLQFYTIKIFQKQKKELNLIYSIDFGEYSTKPKLILSPQSTIPYKLYDPLELLKLLYKEFNKIKASHKILIKIFDSSMKNALKIFIKYLYSKKFSQKLTFPLFDGIEPVMSRKSELILYFKQKRKEQRVVRVQKDEILIKHTKPLCGQNGFDAYGKIINNIHTNSVDNITIDFDPQSIYIQEDESTKLYISKKDGYVHYDGLHISVDKHLQLNEVSRYDHLIDAYIHDQDTNLSISDSDETKDSIGEGVKLVCKTINVDGFVGANSYLDAHDLTINGATHQSSRQSAHFATINRHKGTLRCHKAKISLLEGGIVHASTVEIDSSLGGEIFAENVIIGHTKNRLKVYASNSITVHLVSGEDNIFKINYKEVPILLKKIEFIKKEIDDLKYKLKQAQRFKPHNMQLIRDEITTLQEEITAIENSYKKASISISEPLRGLNHIIFTINEKNEFHYKTDSKSYMPFHLEIQDNTITLLPPSLSLTLEE